MSKDIHDIAEYGSIEEMRELLLKGGIDVNSSNEYGTPLHYSFDNDKAEMALFLLEKGANPKIQDDEGYTALHIALKHNAIEIAEAILKKYPQVVNIESEEWGSPLLQAIYEDRPPYNMVKLLISYGADKQADNVLPHVKAYDIDELTEIFSEELKDFVE